jgi:hypothetical protein
MNSVLRRAAGDRALALIDLPDEPLVLAALVVAALALVRSMAAALVIQ